MGVVFTMKALVVVIMGGVGNLLGCLVAGLMLGFAETLVARFVDPGLTLAANYALFLLVLLLPAGGTVRARRRDDGTRGRVLAALRRRRAASRPPCRGSPATTRVSFGINLLQFAVMATAWGMFSGPTRLVSLATVGVLRRRRLHGRGAGRSAALAGGAGVGALALGVVLALAVGFATLRLSGVYFVIFTFGLAELVKQLVTWYEVNVTRTLGRYVFLDITQREIYLQLLALLALALLGGLAACAARGWASRCA